ncbi:flagellar export chaperone FliS [Lysinibacillus fusiformis]|uniref:Flagellar secretion chaperone FliS n=1 Tax=Lysinibacillus fusiformis TaxID=28031 RepID=A0A1H9M2H9_9BACI|nr:MULTISPECIES: flagellar export chaperone FliS [Lysinibacillus]MDC6268327.1 flagellar export chaperone FliS [Lysinibacillus sphaericus]MDN4969120.1 flagellar export chaperone FliS [Lysinibacillus fusiformis]MED4668296.1 flagellar export chaperone FliS [Lysinibacillus fusiformis]NOG29167.1 flagellar export chaperone FliS [Lysinibacillus fusiformis]QAS58693.1 flagella export chaperone FliS [Lysinibacillus sphaericus]
MAANLTAQNAYKQNSVTTASPGELTLMLYNGCLKFLNKAKQAIQEKDIQEKNTNLIKSQAIISELMATLNMDIEISKQMLPLYEYMNHRLVEANIQNDVAVIEEVEGLVTEFRDTWKEVIRINRQQQFGQGNSGQI